MKITSFNNPIASVQETFPNQTPTQTKAHRPPFKTRPLTKGELCDFLRASKTTIDQYNREGMPRFFVGKQCRYIPAKVLQWLERRAQNRVCPAEETFDLGKELKP